MSELIEDCLRAKGVRYFHGHHEREYFFRHGKLHVHLDRGGAAGDEITVTVSPDRYYPAEGRDRFCELAARWAAGDSTVLVSVFPSSDPGLVGVMVGNTERPVDVAALTALVDRTVAAAVDLFEHMPTAVLRDAG